MILEQVFICANKEQYDEIASRMQDHIQCVGWCDLLQERSLVTEDRELLYVAADEDQLEALKSKGISRECICVYSYFSSTIFANPLNGAFLHNENGLILGMSHAQCGLDWKELRNANYFSIASPSMDAFLHLKYYEKIASDYPEQVNKLKSIIIELPYYIFNYDLSRFGKFVYTKLLYYKIIDNFHHFGESKDQCVVLEDYFKFLAIFKEREIIIATTPKTGLLYKIAKKIRQNCRIARMRDKVWFSEFGDTVNENKKHLSDLMRAIRRNSPNAEITILVMPFNPVFRKTHTSVCNKWKAVFYNFFQSEGTQIIDMFDCMKSSWDFDDHCHLTPAGRTKYSKLLSDQLSWKSCKKEEG